MSRWLSAIFAALIFSACSTAPVVEPSAATTVQVSGEFVLNGRVAIRHNGDRQSAGLHWTHRRASDEILLLGPLGQTAARVYRDGYGATLEDGSRRYQAEDAATLMEKVLGWQLPLDGLPDWVLARPQPGSAAEIEKDAAGRLARLRQSGWEIRYPRYAGETHESLPARLELQRADLQVQLLIDEWKFSAP
jgi:outer membrane lipoprotein LolB